MTATLEQPQSQTQAKKAKVFMNGRSQAVRLPLEFRFDSDEVYIRKDEKTGDVILSKRANDWSDFLQALEELHNSDELDMFNKDENIFARDKRSQDRNLFDDWEEFFKKKSPLTDEEYNDLDDMMNMLQAEREKARQIARNSPEVDIFADWEE